MKPKAAVISLYYGSYNYGGVLQAYAMNRLLEQRGVQSEQLLYRKTKTAASRAQSLRSKRLSHLAKRSAEKMRTRVTDALADQEELALRREAFDRFKEQYIRQSDRVYSDEDIAETVPCYDIFVAGSDQICKHSSVTGTYLLDFVPAEKRKFSYAASVAVAIPDSCGERYRSAVPKLDGASVRERSAQAMLRDICGCDVEWVLDPVMTLTPSDWESVIAAPVIEGPYLFCYFLGEDRALRSFAKRYAKRCGLKLVTLPFAGPEHSFSDFTFGDERLYAAGPAEYLSLIRNAACVLTDSFHAAAFSILFQRPFWVLDRSAFRGADLRVTDLLSTFGLQERLLSVEGDPLSEAMHAPTLDFSEVQERLRTERKRSLAYLDRLVTLRTV